MSLTTLSYPTNKITIVGHVPEQPLDSGWEKVASRRRAEINSRIPQSFLVPPALLRGRNHAKLADTCGILSSRELAILRLTATKLLECVHDQTFTAVEVATAFCKSAAVAHQAVETRGNFQ
jgi:amidase